MGAADGGEREFAALYDRTHQRVLAYCVRRTTTRADALDAAADTYLVAWRRSAEIPQGDEALLWLFGVARRVLANQRRGQGRQLRLLHRLPPEDGSDRRTPDEAAVQAEEERQVLRALEQLPPDDRELLRLSAWERLSGRELAAAFGCSEDAVKVRLHRARRRLAKEYEKVERRRLRPPLRTAGGMTDA